MKFLMLRKHDVYSLKISFYYLSQTGHLWKISTSFCTEGMPLTQRFSSRQSPNSTRYVIQNSIQSQKRKEKSALYDNSTISNVISLSLSQSLYYIIGNYHLRVLVLSMQEKDPYSRMASLRPVPSAFIAFGSTREGRAIKGPSHFLTLERFMKTSRHAHPRPKPH